MAEQFSSRQYRRATSDDIPLAIIFFRSLNSVFTTSLHLLQVSQFISRFRIYWKSTIKDIRDFIEVKLVAMTLVTSLLVFILGEEAPPESPGSRNKVSTGKRLGRLIRHSLSNMVTFPDSRYNTHMYMYTQCKLPLSNESRITPHPASLYARGSQVPKKPDAKQARRNTRNLSLIQREMFRLIKKDRHSPPFF